MTTKEIGTSRLGDMADVVMGTSPPGNSYNNKGTGVPLLNGPTEFGRIHPREVQWTTKPVRICEPGDILFCVRGNSTGSRNIADKAYCIGRGLAFIRGNRHSDVRFIWHFLASVETALYDRAKGAGSTFPCITSDELKDWPAKLPAILVQKKIAQILDGIDEAIEASRAVIDQTRQLKTALLQDLLTNGLPGTGKRIQPEARPLSSVVGYWQYGLSESLSEKGNYPCLRMNNYERGRIVANPLKYIDLPQVEFERYRLNQNDILFNRTNSRDLVGKVGIFQLEGDFVFASYLVRLTPDTTQIVPEFLNILLNTELYQQRIRDLATPGVSQCNINVENLKKLCIPVPKLREQQEVVRVVESIENRLLAESSVLDRLIASKAALSQGLLTGRIPVNGGAGE